MANTKTRKWSPAVIFLGIVAVLILAVLGFFAWVNSDPIRTLRIAFVPPHSFAEETPAAPLNYSTPEAWYQRPKDEGLGEGGIDVFFVHPTTLLERSRWTDPLDDEATLARTDQLILRGQALAFAPDDSFRLHIPRYRQATFGAFLDESGDGLKAIILAYGDVLRAFDAFKARIGDRPFVLAGHSQGSMHLLALLRDRITAQGLQNQMLAAYLVGWPVSVEADLGALEGVGACASPTDLHCAISWQTFGPDGEPKYVLAAFGAVPGLSGASRAGTQMLCTNPLTWTMDGTASAEQHVGAKPIDPDSERQPDDLTGLFAPRCGEDGILYLSQTPGIGWRDYVLAGENYHPYDIHFFFNNIRANVRQRISTLPPQR